MRCDDYEVLISALADGEIRGSEKADLEHHLATCTTCRNLYQETLALQVDLGSMLLDCGETPDIEAAVMSRVVPQKTVRLRWAWAAAAAVMAAALVSTAFIVIRHDTARQNYVLRAEQPDRTPSPKVHIPPVPERRKMATAEYRPGHWRPECEAAPLVHHRHKSEKPVVEKPIALAPAPLAVETASVTVEYDENSGTTVAALRSEDVPQLTRLPGLTNGERVVQLCESLETRYGQCNRSIYQIRTNEENNKDPM